MCLIGETVMFEHKPILVVLLMKDSRTRYKELGYTQFVKVNNDAGATGNIVKALHIVCERQTT